MSKKCYRFFGGLLNAQANWLNQMSQKGYRLVRTGRMLYEFEKCNPDEVTYCVEFIGEKSKESATDYADFLEDMGYKVFFKNINLNYSVGKVRLRPWAEMGGCIFLYRHKKYEAQKAFRRLIFLQSIVPC